jgi:hypothetical protein
MMQVVVGASLSCLVGGLLIPAILLFRQGGYGANDFGSITLWTALFALVLGLAVYPSALLLVRIPIFFAYLLAAVMGVLVAFLWAIIVVLVLGPQVGAFSIPPLPGWVVGGASGMLTGALRLHLAEKEKHGQLTSKSVMWVMSAPLLIVLILSLGAVTISKSNPESLVLIIPVRWEPGSEPTRIDDPLSLLTKQEVSQLELLGLGGILTPQSGPVEKTGPNNRLLLVMQHKIDEPEVLPLPDNANAIYIQTANEWLLIPADVPKLKQDVLLKPFVYDNGYEATFYCIDVGPGLSCRGGFDWPAAQRQN